MEEISSQNRIVHIKLHSDPGRKYSHNVVCVWGDVGGGGSEWGVVVGAWVGACVCMF